MKLAVQRRRDLKLILMSATIQLDLFAKYFEGAPVIQVPGRLFPIELQCIPVKEHDIDAQKKSVKLDTGPYLKVLQVCFWQIDNGQSSDLDDRHQISISRARRSAHLSKRYQRNVYSCRSSEGLCRV